jgi:putative transposase
VDPEVGGSNPPNCTSCFNKLPVIVEPLKNRACVRYVSLNPVRARLVARAEDWAWSSVRAHLARRDDGLVRVAPVLSRIDDFAALLAPRGADAQSFARIREAEGHGRPLANADFIAGLERILGRPIARRAPGRKPKHADDVQEKLL